MNEAERRIAEHDDMIRDLVENDPLFSNFTVIEAETTHGRRLVLVKRVARAFKCRSRAFQ
jgi:hypothetical protein